MSRPTGDRKRAMRVAEEVRRYSRHYLGEEVIQQYAISDMIADMLHLAKCRGMDTEKILETARLHYTEESWQSRAERKAEHC